MCFEYFIRWTFILSTESIYIRQKSKENARKVILKEKKLIFKEREEWVMYTWRILYRTDSRKASPLYAS